MIFSCPPLWLATRPRIGILYCHGHVGHASMLLDLTHHGTFLQCASIWDWLLVASRFCSIPDTSGNGFWILVIVQKQRIGRPGGRRNLSLGLSFLLLSCLNRAYERIRNIAGACLRLVWIATVGRIVTSCHEVEKQGEIFELSCLRRGSLLRHNNSLSDCSGSSHGIVTADIAATSQLHAMFHHIHQVIR